MQNTLQTRSGFDAALAVWHRRKWLAVLAFLIPLAATAGATRAMPPIYESTATLIVEPQQVEERLVGPSVASELETRLRTISQRILSRSRLVELITQYNLYPELRARATPEEIAARLRRDIGLQFQEIRDPIGRDWTITLNLSYRGRDPDTVARVANALAMLFVEENANIRQQQAAGTTQFLRVQLEDARLQLEGLERRLSERQGGRAAPPVNLQGPTPQAMDRLNGQLRVNIEKQAQARERRDGLVKRLTEVSGSPQPTSIATYSANQARQLRDGIAEVEAQLTALRDEERALRRTIAAAGPGTAPVSRTDEDLQLSREYEATKQIYQSLLQHYEEARLAERMEQGPQGGQLRILDSAVAPQHPVAPRRLLILLVGLAMSAAGAVGVAGLAEARDTSFHTLDDLRAFTSVPVLVSIPPIITGGDARGRRLRFFLSALAAGLTAVTVVAASAYLARSNDLLVRLLATGRF
ncbi:MAG: hypothetical protein E6G98_00250 [Bacillati bacterium ANGP1]|uniref:Tyrosine-protein kinase G-rich domain-containing protein n=1 Tax=Candidatus Segetimicrobium genomatis TaxID=2569760 RepID=A0A537LZR3_9BACT|nr:MAG: hypothetical protein E6G98_00250 [Terrabacteria group bacterium ANGP1]